MNNHPEDDSTELKPGDVIYINEPKAEPPEPPEDPEPPQTPPGPRPDPKPRPTTFEIPLAEDKKPTSESRPPADPKPRPPAFDIPPAETKKTPPPEPEEEEAVEEAPVEPEPEPEPVADDDQPPEPEEDESDEPQEPADQQEEAPRPRPTRPKLQPLDAPPTDPPEAAPAPSAGLQSLRPGPSAPAPPQLQPPPPPLAPPPGPPPAAQTPPGVLPSVPPPPPPTQPGHLQPGQDFSFISPQAAVGPPPMNREALPLPAPPTDLQGNLAASPALGTPAQPLPEALPLPVADEEEPAEVVVPPGEKSNRGLKIFGVFTLLIIVVTVTLGVFFLGPMLQQALESSRLNEAREFEHVLVNLLQVENQEIEIKLADTQLDNIVPNLTNPEGRASISGTLKVEYSAEAAAPSVSSEYEFDISPKIDNQRENIILDIAAVFTDEGEAYFKLDDLKINDRVVNLEETSFAGRWSDLEALLQAGSGSEAVLEENESALLSYIANLLDLYSYPHYVPLLPIFNISSSQDHHQAKEILLASGAYELDSGSCQAVSDAELTCTLTIDYAKLYAAYEDIYEVLGQSIPAHYGILQVADDPSHNLPEVVKITFDKDRYYPVSISVAPSANEISASSLLISYKNFDDSAFEPRPVNDPLGLAEYHEQIREYERELGFR